MPGSSRRLPPTAERQQCLSIEAICISVAIVLALPLLGALERVRPTDVVELAKTLVSRFGVGAVRSVRSVYDAECEPSKFDDHRED